MDHIVCGVVHGRVVELDENPGLRDGERVTIVLRPVGDSAQPAAAPTAAGMLADCPEFDDYMEQVYRERRQVAGRGSEA